MTSHLLWSKSMNLKNKKNQSESWNENVWWNVPKTLIGRKLACVLHIGFLGYETSLLFPIYYIKTPFTQQKAKVCTAIQTFSVTMGPYLIKSNWFCEHLSVRESFFYATVFYRPLCGRPAGTPPKYRMSGARRLLIRHLHVVPGAFHH